jgi:DNA adenine methylase
MQYLGGKSRLAKELAAVIAPCGKWWEPFCGGLSVSVQLARFGPGTVSDFSRPLIALYRAVRDGWDPPSVLTESAYAEARSLPDTDPLKAFAGFGCSFGGKWFGGYARGAGDYAAQSRSALLRDIPKLRACKILHLSFFSVNPRKVQELPEVIYADPPYAGTTPYKGVSAFDHPKFWVRCQEWAALGVRVFVSEYQCPVPHELVWSKEHKLSVRDRAGCSVRIERLFRVLP